MRRLATALALAAMAAPLALSAEQPMTIRIDPGKIENRIDEKIYGHFLEHIYHSVNGGLWGEMIWDRSFEQTAPGAAWKIEDGCLVQRGGDANVRLVFGDAAWRDHYAPERIAAADIPSSLNAVATKSADGQRLYFRVVNPAKEPAPVRLAIADTFRVAKATLKVVAPGGLETRNTLDQPDAVRPEPGEAKTSRQEVSFTLPPLSAASPASEAENACRTLNASDNDRRAACGGRRPRPLGKSRVMEDPLNRCTRCVLPDTYPGITFDQGVCNYCRTHEKETCQGTEKLHALLESARNEKGNYDCVVGVSGGRDSTFALYYLAKVCGLRAIAYTVDNGFVSEAAKENTRRIVKSLNVQLVIEPHDLLKKNIRHNVSSWLRKPSPGMVQMLCCGCRLGMFRGLLRFAKKKDIPLVVLGAGSGIERCRYKEQFLTGNPLGRMKWIRNHKGLSLLLGLLYEGLRNPLYFLNPARTVMFVKEYLYFFGYELMQKLFYPHQRLLFLFHYMKWDPQEITATIRKELDWTRPSEATSAWRFDCHISFLKSYFLRRMVGFSEEEEILSNMIREDLITRPEALEKIRDKSTFPQQLLAEVLDSAGIDAAGRAKLEAISPPE
jgi:hypothetical protein